VGLSLAITLGMFDEYTDGKLLWMLVVVGAVDGKLPYIEGVWLGTSGLTRFGLPVLTSVGAKLAFIVGMFDGMSLDINGIWLGTNVFLSF